MKAIIISVSQYKEKDAIITALSEDGLLSFNARRVFDIKSKNSVISNPLTIADLEFSDTNKSKYLSLKDANVIFNPLTMMGNLNKLAALQMIDELILKCLDDSGKKSVYKVTLVVIEELQNNDDNLAVILFYIAQILKNSGYGFEIDKCLICGSKKDIVGVSFLEGGFICRSCSRSSDIVAVNFLKDELLFIRDIFKASMFSEIPYRDIKTSSKLLLLKELLIFIKDNIGVNIKSSELLMK
jgi:DNA repair protein RecO (recombination protein O)